MAVTTSPPGQTRNDAENGPAFPADLSSRVGAFWQSGGWSHTNHTPAWVRAGRLAVGRQDLTHFRVSGNSPLQYSSKTALPDARSRGPSQRTLTDVWKRGSEPAAASRDAGPDFKASSWKRPIGRSLAQRAKRGSPPSISARRSDRCGQAPKGAGGMPRRHQNSGVEGCDKSGGAAQRASSPEYPSNPGN